MPAINGNGRRPVERPQHEVVVIGAGPGGIAAGVKLKRAGVEDFVILERSDRVGGSWRDNTYPGIGVDVPAIAYQYSFARKPDWSRVFPKGAEVQAYHVDVADRFGLGAHLRFNTEVTREVWDEQHRLWQLHTADGELVSTRFLISAVGAFITARSDPGIAGLADFQGKVQRPAEWDPDYDHRGKRVAVIGTGASSVQITPAIASEVEVLEVYQRTPVWCLPKPDVEVPPVVHHLLGTPGLAALLHGEALLAVELALRLLVSTPKPVATPVMSAFDTVAKLAYRGYLRATVSDPQTRRALAPRYGPIAKRPTLSNTFLAAFNRANTHLITTPIERITATGLRTTDGVDHEIDMLVLATGYHLFSDPESYRPGMIVGRGGFDLGAYYAAHGLQAYESVAVPRLPNRWMLVGPYSWTGTGWHALIEITANHAVRAIAEARRRGAVVAEVRQDAHERYHAEVCRRGRNIKHYLTVQNRGTNSYYVNSQGDSPYIRPSTVLEARWRSTHFRLDDYVYEPTPWRLPKSHAAVTGNSIPLEARHA